MISACMTGMAIAPWECLAGGKIRTDAEEEQRRESGEKGRMLSGRPWERTEDQRKVCLALEKVASEVGAKSIQAGECPDGTLRAPGGDHG